MTNLFFLYAMLSSLYKFSISSPLLFGANILDGSFAACAALVSGMSDYQAEFQ